MAILRRLMSGLAWIALVAAGLYLVRPGLFPEVRVPLPPDLGEEPRKVFGAAFLLIGAAIGLGALLHRPPRRNASVAYAGPSLDGPVPRPSTSKPLVPAAPAPTVRSEQAVYSSSERDPAPVAAEPGVTRDPDSDASTPAPKASDASEGDAEQPWTAVGAARARWAVAPADAAARSDLAEALSHLAGHEEEAGRIETALGLDEEVVELRRSVADADPDAAAPAEALAAALAQLAGRREARGQVGRARDLYGEAAGIAERLSWKEPESQMRRDRQAVFKTEFDRLNAALSANDS